MTRFLVFLCLLSQSAVASAAEWWLVDISGRSPDRMVTFIDKSSAVPFSSRRLKAWTYYIHEKPDDEGVRKSKSLNIYDCTLRTIRLVMAVNYGNNERHMGSVTIPSYRQSDDPVVPDTVGEELWKFVCEDANLGIRVDGNPDQTAARVFRTR